jgi:uncharacterized membrane protein
MSVLDRLRHDDGGQLLLLILVYSLIAAALVTVVVDTSRAFLHRRSLTAAADAAAISAANALDPDAFYAAGAHESLPLAADGVQEAVRLYAADAGLAGRFDEFSVSSVSTDGARVTVTFTATVPLSFTGALSAGFAGRAPVSATASAVSPYAP